jgi:hypothetical protein
MNDILHRHMVALSNNSQLTGQAAVKLSEALEKMEPADRQAILRWFEHALREQQLKIGSAKRRY